MSGFSNYAANQILECYFRRSAGISVPAALYMSLHTGNPGADGTANVTTYTGYARVRIDNVTNFLAGTTVVQSDAAGRKLINGASVQFPTVAGAGFTATHVGIWDALSGGNFIAAVDLTASLTYAVGDIPIVNTSNLTLIQATQI